MLSGIDYHAKIEYHAKKISGLKGPEIFVLLAELRRIMKK